MTRKNNKLFFAPIGLFELYIEIHCGNVKKFNPAIDIYEVLIIGQFLLQMTAIQ